MFSWFLESEHQARKDAVDQLILDVHSRCIRNREALQRVDRCGCFYCLAIFDPQEIEEWIEDEGGDTALCPRCEIDSVPPNRATILWRKISCAEHCFINTGPGNTRIHDIEFARVLQTMGDPSEG